MGRRLVDFLSNKLPARLESMTRESSLAFDTVIAARLYLLLRSVDDGHTSTATQEEVHDLVLRLVDAVASGKLSVSRESLLASTEEVFPEPTDDCAAYHYSNLGMALYNIVRSETYAHAATSGRVSALAIGGIQANEETMPGEPSAEDLQLVSREIGSLDDALDEIALPFLATILRLTHAGDGDPSMADALKAALSEILASTGS